MELILPSALANVIAHSSSTALTVDKNGGTTALKIERMRGGEQATVTLLADYAYGTSSSYELQRLKLTSDEHVGSYGGPSDFVVFAREAAPWGFALLFGFIVFSGIYIEYFEPRKAKEARLLKELEKL